MYGLSSSVTWAQSLSSCICVRLPLSGRQMRRWERVLSINYYAQDNLWLMRSCPPASQRNTCLFSVETWGHAWLSGSSSTLIMTGRGFYYARFCCCCGGGGDGFALFYFFHLPTSTKYFCLLFRPIEGADFLSCGTSARVIKRRLFPLPCTFHSYSNFFFCSTLCCPHFIKNPTLFVFLSSL